MKPPVMIKRSDVILHPDWTEGEMSLLIQIWCEVESSWKSYHPTRKKYAGGVDHRIAAELSRRSKRFRTPHATKVQRSMLYKAIRFIQRFDEIQQTCEGRLWFDLSKQERDQVPMPVRIRKTSYRLTRESYSALVKLKSVRKWTKVRSVIGSTPKVSLRSEALSLEKCNSCWSASEVRALVSSWSLVMRKSSTSVSAFVVESSDESATLYTPWNHSTISSWRKMKRIATSYLFIRDFNERHSPANWFQLSDGAQNMWIDWETLPSDFEDIDNDLFDEIHRVDSTQEIAKDKSARTIVENQSKIDDESSPAFDNCPSPDESEGCIEEYPKLQSPRPTLRTQSPHLPRSTPIAIQKDGKRNQELHQECSALYKHMEQLQKKQFKKAIQRLRSEIERDVRLSTDMARAIFFEQLGNPGQSGDATFVANLLDDQQQQIRHRFAEFEREHFCANDYVFDTSLDG